MAQPWERLVKSLVACQVCLLLIYMVTFNSTTQVSEALEECCVVCSDTGPNEEQTCKIKHHPVHTPFTKSLMRWTNPIRPCNPESYVPSATMTDGRLTIDCPGQISFYQRAGERVDFRGRIYHDSVDITDVEVIHSYCHRPPSIWGQNAFLRFLSAWMGGTPPSNLDDYDHQIFVQAVPQPEVKERVAQWKKQNFTLAQERSEGIEMNEPLSLIHIHIDSVSWAHLCRQLPLTVKFLKNVAARSKASHKVFEFLGYNIVGFSTRNNITPMHSGTLVPYDNCKTWTCGPREWNTPHIKFNEDIARQDDDRWLFDVWRKRGAVTAFTDEDCEGGNFHSNRIGVADVTDHYLKGPQCEHEFLIPRKGYQPNQDRCVANRNMHEYTFDYVQDFLKKYKNERHFVVSAYQEAHEPSQSVLKIMDKDLVEHLTRLTELGSNTAIALVADHGINYGPLVTLDRGLTEHRLPAFVLLMPSDFIDDNPRIAKTLQVNRRKLVTAYDIYMTFRHMAFMPSVPPPAEWIPDEHKAYSLLTEVVPASRTCEQARIPSDWCSCEGAGSRFVPGDF